MVHVLAVLSAVVVTATALAHLLELPGKKRLGRADYLVVQKIYYPGFTIAGILEVPTVLLLLASTLLTGFGGELADAATRFFGAGRTHPSDSEPWTRLRDRWEHGHSLRAVLAAGA